MRRFLVGLRVCAYIISTVEMRYSTEEKSQTKSEKFEPSAGLLAKCPGIDYRNPLGRPSA
jgi:hypothetical protein